MWSERQESYRRVSFAIDWLEIVLSSECNMNFCVQDEQNVSEDRALRKANVAHRWVSKDHC